MELTAKEVLQNAIDELQRAKERLKEIGELSDESLTDDEILINDIEASIERLLEIEQNPLMIFIEQEVPYRLEEILDVECSDLVKEHLIEDLKENTDQMFNYDQLDNYLLMKLNEFIKEEQ